MNGVAGLGGGYAHSTPDPQPTVAAVLAAATAGTAGSRLVVLAGPPGVGKSRLARGLNDHIAPSLIVDKDWTAGGFILAAAQAAGSDPAHAYGRDEYWQRLRPLEYAGATRLACANLCGRRSVWLTGGWGPELAVEALWQQLSQVISPARLTVLHLDAPPVDVWRQRMAGRGSRTDEPWFSEFAAAVTAHPVWSGAYRLSTVGPEHAILQKALDILQ